METARDLIAVVVELTPGVKNGQYNFSGRATTRMATNGNASSVINNRDGVVEMNGDVDLVAVPSKSFIDGIVDDLVHQVVQPLRTGLPDVHCWALPDRFEVFKDLDLVRAVIVT